jgi:hypothetical protein
MSYSSFGHLALLLSEGIIMESGQGEESSSVHHVHNGQIMPEVCLASALRWFAGGSAYDIMTTFGISHSEVFTSAWFVVEAVNSLKDFDILYPADHNKQRRIADGFFTYLQLVLGVVLELLMAFSSGFISPPTKIVLCLVATLENVFVGESTSLVSIAKLCAMLVAGFLTWQFNTQVPHQIFLHLRECHFVTDWKMVYLLQVYVYLATMHI